MGKQQSELEKLYNAVSSEFDIGDYDSFKSKMSTPDDRRRFYDSVSKNGLDLGDYNSYEDRLKKKVSTVLSPNTSTASTKPLQTSQKNTTFDVNNPFGGQTQEEFIGKENATRIKTESAKPLRLDKSKGLKGIDERSQIEKDLSAKRAQKLQEKGTDVMNSLGVGVNEAYAGIAKIPRYIFEAFGVPQNLLADAVKNNAGEDLLSGFRTTGEEYDTLLGWLGGNNALANSPLTALDKLGDYFQGNAEQIKQKQTKYDQGIYDSITSGNLGEAGAQLINNIAQSVPSMMTMATTSGIGNTAKLGTLSKTVVNALPFASSKANEIRDDENISEAIKPIYSGLYGLAEVIYDQSFGTQALLDKVLSTATKAGGREVAEREAKDFAKGYLATAFNKIKEPLTDVGKNAIEEMATTFSQNLLDKVVVDPDKDLMEGVLDAGIVGGAMGGAFTALNTVISPTTKAKIQEKNQQIDILSNDLDNPNIPEAAKEVILDKIAKTKEEISAELAKEQQAFDSFDEEGKERALELSSQINDIDTSLLDESLSEQAKLALGEQKKALEKEIGSIKPQEQITFDYKNWDEVPENLVDRAVVNDDFSISVTLPKSEADALQNRIDEVIEPDMVRMEGSTDALPAQPTQNIEVAEEVVSEPNLGVGEETISSQELEVPNEVLTKAETDLAALKQVENKTAKYAASIKRLNEAFREGKITEQEFNDTKQIFDDVILESLPSLPKRDNLTNEEITSFDQELVDDDITVNDIIDYERTNSTEQLINEAENVPKTVQESTDDARADDGKAKESERVQEQATERQEKTSTESKQPKQSSKPNEGLKSFDDRTDKEHADYIRNKFITEFSKKGVTKEQAEVAVALMNARAKVSGKGDTWFRQIEDIRNGEFESDNVLYQFIPKKLKNLAKMAVGMAIIWNMNAKISNKTFQYKNDIETNNILSQIAENQFVAFTQEEGASNPYGSKSFKGNNSFNYLKELWAKAGYPKIKIEKGNRSNYNPITNQITIQVNGHQADYYVPDLNEKGQMEYVITPRIILAEISHALQASNGDLSVGRYVVDFLKSGLDYNKQYKQKGSIENEAHYVIEKELLEQFNKSIKFQEEEGQRKGAVEILKNGRKIIHALDAPDFSTTVHEIAHVFEEELSESQRKIIKNWAETPNWNIETSEAFARGFERYLRDGKAPNEELKNIFQKAKEWLSVIYKSISNSPISKKISPEVKKIYDDLLVKSNIDSIKEEKVDNNSENIISENAEEKQKKIFDELLSQKLPTNETRETRSNVERETGERLSKEIKEFEGVDFRSSMDYGDRVVQQAKQEYGNDWISKLTDKVKKSDMTVDKKAVILVSIENDLRRQLLDDPKNSKLKKQIRQATKEGINLLTTTGRATAVGVFRQAAMANYNIQEAADAIFSTKENEARNKVEEAIFSTSEDVQKEYESVQGDLSVDTTLQSAIEEGVEKRLNELYEALPSRRRQQADKAIKALDNIQKRLRSKSYDASIGLPIAIIDAGISTIKAAIKAGVAVADAVELGITRIKQQYGKKWDNEDQFRSDMLDGFKQEGVDTAKQRQQQDNLKQALIEAGYGKEITVSTRNGKEKRNILDWKKLTGEEGSFETLTENLSMLKDKGFSDAEISELQSQLEEEYNDIHASIIEKSINELNRRNTPKEGKQKILARRLAELYNLGVYDGDNINEYQNVLNNALGFTTQSQEAFNEIRKLNESLARLLDSRDSNGNKLSDVALASLETQIKNQISKVIQKAQFAEGNGVFKTSVVLKNVFSAMQRMMLASVGQLIENPFSGKLNDLHVALQDAFKKGKWDTKELAEHRKQLANVMYKDAALYQGDEYGGVGNPFTSKNDIEDFINGLSKNAMYQAFIGALSGRQYLDAADSYFKIKRTEKEFTHNLLSILTDRSNPNGAMEQNDALQYVSEIITGQTFTEAKDTARRIINDINEKAGKELLRSSETNVIRVANDLVKDNLVNGQKVTAQQVEAAFKAAYKTAGKSIGHESNNIITDAISSFSQTTEQKLKDALKKKDWSTAALLNMTNTLVKNVAFPFVGGGTNWTVIGLQKMGVPTEWFRSDVGFSKKPIDLSTKEGNRDLEKALSANATRQRQYARNLIGSITALSAILAMRSLGDEDEYEKWLKKHPETKKIINKLQPVPLTLYMASDEGSSQMIDAMLEVIGRRKNYDNFKLQRATENFYEGYQKANEKKTAKAWGELGEVVGRRFNIPYLQSIQNFDRTSSKVYKEFTGEYKKEKPTKSNGFIEGYFKGGFAEFLGLNDNDNKK